LVAHVLCWLLHLCVGKGSTLAAVIVGTVTVCVPQGTHGPASMEDALDGWKAVLGRKKFWKEKVLPCILERIISRLPTFPLVIALDMMCMWDVSLICLQVLKSDLISPRNNTVHRSMVF